MAQKKQSAHISWDEEDGSVKSVNVPETSPDDVRVPEQVFMDVLSLAFLHVQTLKQTYESAKRHAIIGSEVYNVRHLGKWVWKGKRPDETFEQAHKRLISESTVKAKPRKATK